MSAFAHRSGLIMPWSKDSGPMDVENGICNFISPHPGAKGLLCTVSIGDVEMFEMFKLVRPEHLEFYPSMGVGFDWLEVSVSFRTTVHRVFYRCKKVNKVRNEPHQMFGHWTALLYCIMLVNKGTSNDEQCQKCSVDDFQKFRGFNANWSLISRCVNRRHLSNIVTEYIIYSLPKMFSDYYVNNRAKELFLILLIIRVEGKYNFLRIQPAIYYKIAIEAFSLMI